MNKIIKIILIVMLVITVALVVAAAATGGSTDIVSLNLVWAYTLVGITIVSAIVCAILGVITSPSGMKSTLISLLLGVGVIVGSYLIASSHTVQIFNIGDGGFFDAGDTIISETSIFVAYVVGGAVILAAIGSEIMGFIEGLKK